MGNTNTVQRQHVTVKKREYTTVDIKIPYGHLEMIRVLQREFSYEVKGTIYVNDQHEFVSFEVRTSNEETASYGASDWKISFHTHPDATAQKYGVRYYSPPSVDDIMEIYDHSMQFVPDNKICGYGEVSIIFANEGVYVLQVNRETFNPDNLPLEGLEAQLEATLTEYLVSQLRHGLTLITERKSINSNMTTVPQKTSPKTKVDLDNPDVTLEDFSAALRRVSRKVTESYGLNMSFYSWTDLERDGLTLKVCNYFLNKKVLD